MPGRKVIVFGATGAVGSRAALEAHNRGADVYLAMRDTKKATPNLPDSLHRLQADLTDPASSEKAVKETGAEAAFIYITFMTDMHPAVEALKKGGIKHVVLLSSYTVYPDHKTAIAGGIISKEHALAEIALDDAKVPFTALRPMYFTSNIWQSKAMIQKGTLYVYGPDTVDDYIAPEDIGSVAGVHLVSGETGIIPLCGPDLITKRNAWKIVGEELGKDLKIVEITADKFMEEFSKTGHPEAIAQTLVKQTDMPREEQYPDDRYKEASGNIKKYTGRDPIDLRTWVKKHKDEAA